MIKISMACFNILKWVVFCYNLLFMCVGVATLGLGAWCLTSGNVFHEDRAGSTEFLIMENVSEHLAGRAAIALFIVGGIMIIMGFFGCCGALQQSPCLLGTVFTALLVLIMAECGIMLFVILKPDQVHAVMKDKLTQLITNLPSEYDTNEMIRNSTDFLQQKYECCGVDGYQSWAKTEKNMAKIASGSFNYHIPESCCKDLTSIECDSINKVSHTELSIFITDADRVFHTEGCATQLEKWLRDSDRSKHLWGISIGVFSLQILMMMASAALCGAVRRLRHTATDAKV